MYDSCDPMDCMQHTRLPCPSPTPRACSNSCPSSWWCHPTISFSTAPFSSCLQSFPASGSFLVSQFFTSGGQSIGASASTSVLPMNIRTNFLQDWPVWSPCIPWDSQDLLQYTVQKHQFLGVQLSLWSNSHLCHDYWKNHSFDYMDLCQQSNVSDF